MEQVHQYEFKVSLPKNKLGPSEQLRKMQKFENLRKISKTSVRTESYVAISPPSVS